MNSVDSIITALGGTTATAQIFGMRFPARVSDWRRRRSIPVEYWPRLIEAATERGVSLDYTTLVELHASNHGRKVAS